MLTKFISAKTTVLKGDYGFDEAFNNFDEIDNNCSNLYAYKSIIPKNINNYYNIIILL